MNGNSLKLEKNKPKYNQNTVFERLMTSTPLDETSPVDNLSPYFPIIQQLQSKFNDFDEISANFPPLSLPTAKKPQKPKVKLLKTVIKSPETIKKAKTKPKIDEIVPIFLNSTYSNEIESNKIGPGYYKIYKTGKISGGSISQIPRFSLSAIEKAEEYLNSKRKVTINYEKNKSFSFSKHQEKIKKIQNFEAEVQKLAKISLDKLKKEQKLIKYQEKMENYEWKKKKNQIIEAKFYWYKLLSIISVYTLLYHRYKQRKIFKTGCYHNFIVLLMVSVFIGKMKRVLYRLRHLKLQQRLQKKVKTMKKWMNQRKKHYKTVVSLVFFVNFSTANTWIHFLAKFKKTMLFIKDSLISLMKIRQARFLAFNLLYSKLSTKSKIFFRLKPQGSFMVPKSEFINYFKAKAKIHLKNMKIYKEKLELYYSKQKDQSLSISEIPTRPCLVLYSNVSEIIYRFRKRSTIKPFILLNK